MVVGAFLGMWLSTVNSFWGGGGGGWGLERSDHLYILRAVSLLCQGFGSVTVRATWCVVVVVLLCGMVVCLWSLLYLSVCVACVHCHIVACSKHFRREEFLSQKSQYPLFLFSLVLLCLMSRETLTPTVFSLQWVILTSGFTKMWVFLLLLSPHVGNSLGHEIAFINV